MSKELVAMIQAFLIGAVGSFVLFTLDFSVMVCIIIPILVSVINMFMIHSIKCE